MKAATAALAAALALAGLTAPAAAATLRGSIMVEGEVVRLGDIFSEAGPRAEVAVANAPAPGRRIVLDYRWLGEVARYHGVSWQPTSRFDRAVVERAGRAIGIDEILDALRPAFPAGALGRNGEIELAQRNLEITVALDAPPTVEIRNLVFTPSSGRFSATVIAGGDHPSAQRWPVSGRVHQTVSLPAPRRAIAPGEVIAAHDLQWITVRDDGGRLDQIADMSRLVGLTPRYRLRPGEPVRQGDVRAPVVVERDSTVLITLRTANMTLTAQGRAVEDGAQGETIRVVNSQSKKTIEATVAGPGTVTVTLAAPLPLH